ncbi:MAG: beta-lactamase family protein [Verrucomicrobiales bacterium]|nr:beta-lactamase family protein [Verrucomicrobiales bacterium]MCP5559214.1 beta-lactamase family protein [Verrucomicrobiaceae bacterium]
MKNALLLVLSTVLTAAGAEPIDLSAKLVSVLHDSPVPCIGAAVIVNGQIIGYGASGVRKKGDPTLVTRDDVFHIGSCGKAMTATLIGMLVDDGKLRFDMPLKDLFKSEKIHPLLQPVTLRQILDHESGLPANIPQDTKVSSRGTNSSPLKQRSALIRTVLTASPSSVGQFVYSNVGYATAGHAAELATGIAYEDLMRERLFKPLGMTSAGFGAPGNPAKVDAPWGHLANPIPPGPRADNPPAIAPAGTMYFSMLDWAKFIQFQLTGEPAGLIQPTTLQSLHTIAHPGTTYSCGWGHTPRTWAQGEALTHSGSNTMWFCIAWLAPKTQSAVLVACNYGIRDEAAKTCDQAAAMFISEYLR